MSTEATDMSTMHTNNNMMGGKKKLNGHKMSCMCPICKNMMKKKHGGENTPEEGMTDVETSPSLELTPEPQQPEEGETATATTALGGSRRRKSRSSRRRKSRSSKRSSKRSSRRKSRRHRRH
jgi:hypothetical protein